MRDNETDEATDARVPLQRQRALVHAHSSDTKSKVRARVWKPTSVCVPPAVAIVGLGKEDRISMTRVESVVLGHI